MKFPNRHSLIVAGVASLALLTASCASDAADTTPAGETPAVQETLANPDAGGSETGGTDAGETDAGQGDFKAEELEGELVASFPKEVPLYDARVESSLAAIAEYSGDPEWNVALITDDSLATVDAKIREDYSSNGWSIGMDMDFAGGYQLTARGNGYIVSITYNDFGGPEVMINYGVSVF